MDLIWKLNSLGSKMGICIINVSAVVLALWWTIHPWHLDSWNFSKISLIRLFIRFIMASASSADQILWYQSINYNLHSKIIRSNRENISEYIYNLLNTFFASVYTPLNRTYFIWFNLFSVCALCVCELFGIIFSIFGSP